ncbi:MAG: endonuclease V [Bacteroidota bacterium]
MDKQKYPLAVAPTEAADVQRRLQQMIQLQSLTRTVRSVGGADISYNRGSNLISAALVLLDYPSLELSAVALAQSTVEFPYLSGMLSFRELPPLLQVWELVPSQQKPDLMVFDGHGVCHPRGIGLASHAGVMLDTPALGIAKNPLYGTWKMPDSKRGSYTKISAQQENGDEEQLIGYVLRSRTNVKPVYVSAGHLITQKEALEWALRITPRYRISEPIRYAHKWANKLRTQKEKPGFHRA